MARFSITTALITASLASTANAESLSHCGNPDLQTSEVYQRYLGNTDLTDQNEIVRRIPNALGEHVANQTIVARNDYRIVVVLTHDLDGNLIDYGVQTVRDSNDPFTTFKEIAESLTGLDFGGEVLRDMDSTRECIMNSRPQPTEQAPPSGPVMGGGGDDGVDRNPNNSAAGQLSDLNQDRPQEEFPHGRPRVEIIDPDDPGFHDEHDEFWGRNRECDQWLAEQEEYAEPVTEVPDFCQT